MSYSPAPTQGPLTINVTVTRFVPLPSSVPTNGTPAYPNGFFTGAQFEVAPNSVNSWVTIDTSTNRATQRPYINLCSGANGDPNKVNVLANGINLHFTLKSQPGDTDSYVPLDISFVQYEPNNPQNDDPDGLLTFPQSSVSIPPLTLKPGEGAETLEVYNLWGPGSDNQRVKRHGADYKWRMFLLIKRVGDGVVGVIDPDFQNED